MGIEGGASPHLGILSGQKELPGSVKAFPLGGVG